MESLLVAGRHSILHTAAPPPPPYNIQILYGSLVKFIRTNNEKKKNIVSKTSSSNFPI